MKVEGTMGEAPMHLVSSIQDVEGLQVSQIPTRWSI